MATSSPLLLLHYPLAWSTSVLGLHLCHSALCPLSYFMRSLSIGFIQDSLINCDFHPWGSQCSMMGLSRSGAAAAAAAHAARRRQRESAGCVTASRPPPPLQFEHKWLSMAFTLEESQKGNSHPTSSPVSHSEERLSLIVKTSECEGSDSQPMYHADISGHSAELGLCVTAFRQLYRSNNIREKLLQDTQEFSFALIIAHEI